MAPAIGATNLPAGTGPIPGGTFLKFSLTDRLQAQVNVGSGNLLVRSTDLVLAGIEGNVTLGADYNSLMIGSSIETGAFGHGWRSRLGIDVRLIANGDSTVTFTGPDGVVGVFKPITGTSPTKYTSPGVFKATLVKTSSGWNLTDHTSGNVTAFNSSGKPSKITDRNGNATTVSYNSSGQQTSITSDWGPSAIRAGHTSYGSNGFISAITQDGTDATSHTVSYGYDSSGNLTSITDPDLNQYSFGYDSSHNLTSITTPPTTGGVNELTTITYDSSHRVTSLTRFIGPKSTDLATTRLWYVSSTETQVADPDTDQTQPVANVPHTTYTLDSQKRVTKVTDPAGNSRSTSYTTFNDVATSTNAVGGQTTNTYGANNGESLTKSGSPMGASTALGYANVPTISNPTANFEPSSGTDPQANATAFTYNGAGNLASAKNALAAVASVAYNSDGTVKSSTDPKNGTNSTTYAYNSDHQLISVTPPTGNELAAHSYTYDAFGRPLTITDGASRETTFGYDADGRVTSVSFNDGTITVGYAYDGSGNLIQRTDGSGTTTYTYDNANRLLTRANTAGGKTLTYTYDPVGNLTSLSDGGGTRNYTYDSRNLLTSMTTGNGTLYTFGYDADGRRTATYFNTVTGNATWAARTLTTYDKSGRITRITTALNSSTSNLVFDTSYCYSPFVSGQSCPTGSSSTDKALLQYATDNMTGKVSVYSYDKGNRLTSATNVAAHTYGYTYDSDGNRTSVKTDGTTTQSLTYNSANQISSSGYSYDGAGNMTAAPGASYSYSAAEQMSSSTVNGTTSDHVYAGTGQQELTSAGPDQFVWGRSDQYGQPWLQSFNTGGTSQVYVERDGFGTPLGLHTGGNDFYLVLDNLGSVVAVVNTAGTVVARYRYDPYGNAVSVDESGLSQPNIVRYAGGAVDLSTGLIKLGQRYYDPAIGAFTQQDANQILANPGNGNLYAYAGDSPINYTDPTGQSIWGDVLAGVATVGGAALAVVGVVVASPVIVVVGAIVAIAGVGIWVYQTECKYGGAGSIWDWGQCGVFG
ncbi:MAG TPA: RHS repeat-associated core domain-containing protein [Streptosporangiaceae bacterium]|jgi:RHS repeat-associated protein